MQLILDTKPTIDIKRNMSTLDQESLVEKLDDVIQELKTDICNSNKENIHSQDNIIVADDKDLNSEDDKGNNEEIVENKSPLPDTNGDNDPPSNMNPIGEDVPNENSTEICEASSTIIDDETEKDEDSDPIIINHVNDISEIETKEDSVQPIFSHETHTEENENASEKIVEEAMVLENAVQDDINIVQESLSAVLEDADTIQENINTVQGNINIVQDNINTVQDNINTVQDNITASPEKIDAVQESENVSFADDCEALIDEVETVDLDAEEKECPAEKPTENCEQETLCNVDLSDDTLITNQNEKSIQDTESIELEKETTVERMEVDINKENGEICSREELEALPVDDEDNKTPIAQIEQNENSEEHLVGDKDSVVQDDAISVDEDEQATKSTKCEKKLEAAETVKEKANSESDDELEVQAIQEQDEKSETSNDESSEAKNQTSTNVINDLKNIPSVLKLSNTLDILSDDDETEPLEAKIESQNTETASTKDKQCINIEDDDDIMLIDEDMDSKDDSKIVTAPAETESNVAEVILDNQEVEKTMDVETSEQILKKDPGFETKKEVESEEFEEQPHLTEKNDVTPAPAQETTKPLVPSNFLKSYKKNFADMTRDDLEEFCILKIVESIVDRSNLSEIKSKLKTMAQNIEEYKKKAMVLVKQNRDLQVVLKSVQEEQKKMPDTITPLKITRSVGMQVLMTEKGGMRRKGMPNQAPVTVNNINNKPMRSPNPTPRPVKVPPSPQTIPVPRLVPASNIVAKNSNISQNNANNLSKTVSPLNGIKNSPHVTKGAEKRTRNQTQSITVDLTDDEPPSKVLARNSPVSAPPVRVVPPQNMLAPQRHLLGQNSPRKVYIPISGPQSQGIRAGQTIMLKTVAPQAQGPRGRAIAPSSTRMARMSKSPNKHPAPLPEVKQYQTNHYKALPPAPELKLSKVENGIVISWKIEGKEQDSYEEIASYQLYAYQETTLPPNTSLWKKIGDVKALPLPMACTLTQFMAGFKYYFAVRAVDIRSRYGPFSVPGSILLLNKM